MFSWKCLVRIKFSCYPCITSDVQGEKGVLIRVFAIIKLLCAEVKIASHTHKHTNPCRTI